LIVGQSLQTFKLHVAMLQCPLIALLEEQGADEPCDGAFVWKDANNIGASFDLGIESLKRVGSVDLLGVRFGEAHIGEHVSFGTIHELGKLGDLMRS
jgi:hypothetical protein